MIEKTNKPGPGTYESTKAIEATQWRTIQGVPEQSAKLVPFVDSYTTLYKDNPSPDRYKGLDKLPKSLSRSPGRKRV